MLPRELVVAARNDEFDSTTFERKADKGAANTSRRDSNENPLSGMWLFERTGGELPGCVSRAGKVVNGLFAKDWPAFRERAGYRINLWDRDVRYKPALSKFNRSDFRP